MKRFKLAYLFVSVLVVITSSCSKEEDEIVDIGGTHNAVSLNLVSGDNQTGEPDRELADEIVFIVKDANQNPVEGVKVYFEASNGIIPSSSLSKTDGSVNVKWSLGPVMGNHQLKVRAYKSDGTTQLSGSPYTINANAEFEPGKKKILFLGSSYFIYNNLTFLFEGIRESAGKEEVYIDRNLFPGWRLDEHASNETTDGKIKKLDWDYVILQGVGITTAYPELTPKNNVQAALSTLVQKIHQNNPSTKIIFCMPWAYEDGMTWMEGRTEDYADMQGDIYQRTLSLANNFDILIAPVGWAWYQVLREKNFPQNYLHVIDKSHPSLNGSYLMAATLFSTIYQESSVDAAFSGGVDEDEARYFRTIASSVVLDNLELWHIPSINY